MFNPAQANSSAATEAMASASADTAAKVCAFSDGAVAVDSRRTPAQWQNRNDEGWAKALQMGGKPPHSDRGGCVLIKQVKNQFNQGVHWPYRARQWPPPATGLVEMKAPMCPGVAPVCLACVGTRLYWVLGGVMEPVGKQFGPSAK